MGICESNIIGPRKLVSGVYLNGGDNVFSVIGLGNAAVIRLRPLGRIHKAIFRD